jgi:NADH:ubiquinone oxidoreductase subunit 2 (subunit N)
LFWLVVLLVRYRAIEANYYLRLPIAFFHSTSEQVAEASRQPEMPEWGASEL